MRKNLKCLCLVGLQFHQKKYDISMTQTNYVMGILKTFRMNESRPIGTPMVTGYKFSKEDTTTKVNETHYRSIIYKL